MRKHTETAKWWNNKHVCPFDIAAVKTHSHAALHWSACEQQDVKELNSLSRTVAHTNTLDKAFPCCIIALPLSVLTCLSLCSPVKAKRLRLLSVWVTRSTAALPLPTTSLYSTARLRLTHGTLRRRKCRNVADGSKLMIGCFSFLHISGKGFSILTFFTCIIM